MRILFLLLGFVLISVPHTSFADDEEEEEAHVPTTNLPVSELSAITPPLGPSHRENLSSFVLTEIEKIKSEKEKSPGNSEKLARLARDERAANWYWQQLQTPNYDAFTQSEAYAALCRHVILKKDPEGQDPYVAAADGFAAHQGKIDHMTDATLKPFDATMNSAYAYEKMAHEYVKKVDPVVYPQVAAAVKEYAKNATIFAKTFAEFGRGDRNDPRILVAHEHLEASHLKIIRAWEVARAAEGISQQTRNPVNPALRANQVRRQIQLGQRRNLTHEEDQIRQAFTENGLSCEPDSPAYGAFNTILNLARDVKPVTERILRQTPEDDSEADPSWFL